MKNYLKNKPLSNMKRMTPVKYSGLYSLSPEFKLKYKSELYVIGNPIYDMYQGEYHIHDDGTACAGPHDRKFIDNDRILINLNPDESNQEYRDDGDLSLDDILENVENFRQVGSTINLDNISNQDCTINVSLDTDIDSAGNNNITIQDTINGATPGTVICLPSGKYPIEGSINLNKDGVILRGDGVQNTELWFFETYPSQPDITEGSIEMNLYPGRNFVSFPILPTDNSVINMGNMMNAAGCGITSITMVTPYNDMWNASSGSYFGPQNQVTEFQEIEEIEGGYGIWQGELQEFTIGDFYYFEVTNECTFTLEGSKRIDLGIIIKSPNSYDGIPTPVGYFGCPEDVDFTSTPSPYSAFTEFVGVRQVATYDSDSGLIYTYPDQFNPEQLQEVYGSTFFGTNYLIPPNIEDWWIRDNTAIVSKLPNPFNSHPKASKAYRVTYGSEFRWCTENDLGECSDADNPGKERHAHCISGPYYFPEYICTQEDVDTELSAQGENEDISYQDNYEPYSITGCTYVGEPVPWGKQCVVVDPMGAGYDSNMLCGRQYCKNSNSAAPAGSGLIRYGNFEFSPQNIYHSYSCGHTDNPPYFQFNGQCRLPEISEFKESGNFTISGWFKFGINEGYVDKFVDENMFGEDGVTPNPNYGIWHGGYDHCTRITIDIGDSSTAYVNVSTQDGEWQYFERVLNIDLSHQDGNQGKKLWIDIYPGSSEVPMPNQYNDETGEIIRTRNCVTAGTQLDLYNIKLTHSEDTEQFSHIDPSIYYNTQELKKIEYGRGYMVEGMHNYDPQMFSCPTYPEKYYKHGIGPSDGIIIGNMNQFIGEAISIETPTDSSFIEVNGHDLQVDDIISIQVEIGNDIIEGYNSPYFYNGQAWQPGLVDFVIRKVILIEGNIIYLDTPLRYGDVSETMKIFEDIKVSKITNMSNNMGIENLKLSNAIHYDDSWKRGDLGQSSSTSGEEYVSSDIDLIRIENCTDCFVNNVESAVIGTEWYEGIGDSNPGGSSGTSVCPPNGMFTDIIRSGVEEFKLNDSDWDMVTYNGMSQRNCHGHSSSDCWFWPYNTCEARCCVDWTCNSVTSWDWCGGQDDGCNSNCWYDTDCTNNCKTKCGNFTTPREWLIYGREYSYPEDSLGACDDELKAIDWMVDEFVREGGYFEPASYAGGITGEQDISNIVNETRHILSNGIRVKNSKNIVIANTNMKLPINRGEGENGKMFSIESSNEILIENCEGYRGRHNFSVGGWGTSGIVFSQIKSSGGWGFGIGKTVFDQIGYTQVTPARLDKYYFDEEDNIWKIVSSPASPEIQNNLLTEASGLVQSRYLSGQVFYSHNDSGNPSLFVFESDGTAYSDSNDGEIRLSNLNVTDWEDIAIDGNYIYIGDIGHNAVRNGNTPTRNEYQIYRCLEAGIVTIMDNENPEYTDCETITFTYSDGHHDAETLMVHNSDLYIVTKENGTTAVGLYKLSSENQNWENGNTHSFMKEIDITNPHIFSVIPPVVDNLAQITGGDISPDGTKIAIKTYNSTFVYNITDGDISTTFNTPPTETISSKFSDTEQHEAVAWSWDNNNYYVTMEESGADSENLFAKFGDYANAFDVDADFVSRWKKVELTSVVFGYHSPSLSDKAMSNSILVTDSDIYDGWFSANREGMSGGQGLSTTNTVFWNIRGVPTNQQDLKPWKDMATPGMSNLVSYQPKLVNDNNTLYDGGGIIVGTQNMNVFTDIGDSGESDYREYMDTWMNTLGSWYNIPPPADLFNPDYPIVNTDGNNYLNYLFNMMIKIGIDPIRLGLPKINWYEDVLLKMVHDCGLEKEKDCFHVCLDQQCGTQSDGSECDGLTGELIPIADSADHDKSFCLSHIVTRSWGTLLTGDNENPTGGRYCVKLMEKFLLLGDIQIGTFGMRMSNVDVDITVTDDFSFILTGHVYDLVFDLALAYIFFPGISGQEDDMDLRLDKLSYTIRLHPVYDTLTGAITEYKVDKGEMEPEFLDDNDTISNPNYPGVIRPNPTYIHHIPGDDVHFDCPDFLSAPDCYIIEAAIEVNDLFSNMWPFYDTVIPWIDVSDKINEQLGDLLGSKLEPIFMRLFNNNYIIKIVNLVNIQTANLTLAPDGSHYDVSTPTTTSHIQEQLPAGYENLYHYQVNNFIGIGGDVNFDGEVNIVDIVAIVNHILGDASLTDEQLLLADMNQDGIINVVDVVAIVNIILNEQTMRHGEEEELMRVLSRLRIGDLANKKEKQLLKKQIDKIKRKTKKNRFYPDGLKYNNNLPDAYGLPSNTKKNQKCHNCIFYKKDKYVCERWKAPVRHNYWCKSWQAIGKKLEVNEKQILPKKQPQEVIVTPNGVETYSCGKRSFNECMDYLSSITNYDDAYFNFFENMNESTYESLQNGTMNVKNYMIKNAPSASENNTRGWWQRNTCSCDFHGFGGCNGGQWCCGAGGLGIGCGKTQAVR